MRYWQVLSQRAITETPPQSSARRPSGICVWSPQRSIDPDLQGRFGVRPNVLSVRPGRASFTVVRNADDPSFALAVSSLDVVADLMVD